MYYLQSCSLELFKLYTFQIHIKNMNISHIVSLFTILFFISVFTTNIVFAEEQEPFSILIVQTDPYYFS